MIKRLIHEIHRRSLWQVLGIYLAGSWIALQVVDGVTQNAGLPDWVPPLSLVLLVIGLPIVLATAFVQEGMPGTRGEAPAESAAPAVEIAHTAEPAAPRTRSRLLTWRNAILGGVGGFALLGMAVAAYFLMRQTGFGPWATLEAQGVIDEGILLAEFENTSNDKALGGIVTEALRVDLASSRAITLLPPSRIQEVLRRMAKSPDEALTPALAREVAIRDGIDAVLQGEVGSAGNGYILVASLVSPASNAPLATFRRTAKSADDVIDAIDRLSQDIRSKAGESLREIRDEEPLSDVTTASLDALRKYAEADRIYNQGDTRQARALLEEAIALDPQFAMAYRKLAVVLVVAGGTMQERVDAATKAFELRDRLTERERYLAIALYHATATGDVDAGIDAYQNVLARYPDEPTALNNLAIAFQNRTRWEDAIPLLRRAATGPSRIAPAYTNLSIAYTMLIQLDSARYFQNEGERLYPRRTNWQGFTRWLTVAMSDNDSAAHSAGGQLAALPDLSPEWRSFGPWAQAVSDVGRGRLREARAHLSDAADRLKDLPEVAANRRNELAMIETLVLGPDAARPTFERALKEFDAASPAGRPYGQMIAQATRMGDFRTADALLSRWQAEGGPSATGSQYEDTKRYVAALRSAATNPAAAAAELEAFRTEINCPRCFSWELPDLENRAGRVQQAVQLWETSLAKPERWETFLTYRTLVHERLGEAYDKLGNAAKALEHYDRFTKQWKDADPELQPRVRRALDRMDALVVRRG